MASADFCGLTRCITAKRAVRSDGSRPIRSLEIGLRDLAPGRIRYGTTRPTLPSESHRQRAQISPSRCANCRCTSTVFIVGCVRMGFAARCHRQQHPSALTMRFAVRRLATLARRLPSDNPSRFRPCLRLMVVLAQLESKSVLPQGDFQPMNSRPFWAHTGRLTGNFAAGWVWPSFHSRPNEVCRKVQVIFNVGNHRIEFQREPRSGNQAIK